MTTTNVLIAGVGGQGLVLTTKVVASVAFRARFDVKTSDVIGLAQRGGMVWGSVRFGEQIHAPLIPKGQGDYLLALEELEGLRWVELMKPGAVVVLNKEILYPNRVLLEKEEYPADVFGTLVTLGFDVRHIDARAIATELGNAKLANTILLGHLAQFLPFSADLWEDVIRESVPPKTVEQNLLAFARGRLLANVSDVMRP